jgi:hypothetical protein
MLEIQPILVSVDDARTMLGGIGKTSLYGFLSDGRLTSRKIGKRRLVLVSSILDFIENSEG